MSADRTILIVGGGLGGVPARPPRRPAAVGPVPPAPAVRAVGGGLGGLAAALALGRSGWPVRVLEEAPEFGAIGYGIQLGPNVFPMFERLGISEAVLRQADLPPALVMLDALDGQEIARIPTGDSFRRRFKHPYIVI